MNGQTHRWSNWHRYRELVVCWVKRAEAFAGDVCRRAGTWLCPSTPRVLVATLPSWHCSSSLPLRQSGCRSQTLDSETHVLSSWHWNVALHTEGTERGQWEDTRGPGWDLALPPVECVCSQSFPSYCALECHHDPATTTPQAEMK